MNFSLFTTSFSPWTKRLFDELGNDYPINCILQKKETLLIYRFNVCNRAQEKFGNVMHEIVIVLLTPHLQGQLI